MISETTGYFSTDSSGRDPAMIRIPSCKTCRAKLETVKVFQATSWEIRGHSLISKEAVEGHTTHLLQSIDSVVSRGTRRSSLGLVLSLPPHNMSL